jgi:hypothetical protein
VLSIANQANHHSAFSKIMFEREMPNQRNVPLARQRMGVIDFTKENTFTTDLYGAEPPHSTNEFIELDNNLSYAERAQ